MTAIGACLVKSVVHPFYFDEQFADDAGFAHYYAGRLLDLVPRPEQTLFFLGDSRFTTELGAIPDFDLLFQGVFLLTSGAR